MPKNNFVLYKRDRKISALPWDYNLAFGTYPTVIGFETLDDPTGLLNLGIDTPLINAEEEYRPLWTVIRNNPEYLYRYHGVFDTLIKDCLSNEKYEAKIDQIKEMLLPWVQKDPTSFCTAEEFEKACETLKNFFSIRRKSIRRQLAGELSTDSNEQESQVMVDASELDLLSMGALVLGYE